MNYDPHNKLLGVHPRLAVCVVAAACTSRQPFLVVQGLRTAAEQQALFAQGRTKPGLEVTDKDGLVKRSNHQAHADGYGHAVDLAAVENDGSIDWSTTADYDTIRAAMFAAAEAMTPPLALRWGADWNRNGVAREHGEDDDDHFEIFDPEEHA